MSTESEPLNYEILDRYLETAFQILEGIADVAKARVTLGNYLQYHRQHDLPPRMEQFLRQLFLEKCRKEGIELRDL